ncbi:hypothetical protein ACVIGB_000798 [Bradyrhizobium sp. USDA 4341]
MRFILHNDRGEQVLEVTLERSEGQILCGVTERKRRNPYRQPFNYSDSTIGPIEKRDRQIMSNCSSTIRTIVAKHERPVDRTPEARDGLTDRIRQVLEAFPKEAPEKIAEAISTGLDADKIDEIAGALDQTLAPDAS